MTRVLFFAAIAFVVAVMAAGFAIVGGPGQGRAEQADAERRSDLIALRRYLECRPDGGVLPMSLADDTYCPGRRSGLALSDPVTDAPYDYRRMDDRSFAICARFATVEGGEARRLSIWQDFAFEGQTGCLDGRSGGG